MDPTSPVAKKITEFSNNQNSVKPRDFKSNDSIQIRLQNEFEQHYKNDYQFEIKRGERQKELQVVTNEEAGLCLMAFDLREPWATHRTYQIFDDKYATIFARPEVNADRIVLCWTIMEVIKEHIPDFKNQLVGKYALTRYLLLDIARHVLEHDELGKLAIENPATFVRDRKDRRRFKKCVTPLITDAISDLNDELEAVGDDFDYRASLRDSEWVIATRRSIVALHKKLMSRPGTKTFKILWDDAKGKKKVIPKKKKA